MINKELTVGLYQSINSHDRNREINHWHCSSLAKCPRALYFERKKIAGLPDNEPGGGKKLRWRAGHAIEGTIRPELVELYPNLIANVRFTNDTLDLTGEFDAYDPDSKTLISVKSVHDYAMITVDGEIGLKEANGLKMGRNGREVTNWGLKTDPYLHHEWQEAGYILLFNHPDTVVESGEVNKLKPDMTVKGDYPVDQITYIYITLGGLIACYTTPVRGDIVKRVSDKINYLNKCWAKEELPMCLCQEGQEMFKVTDQYCPYRTPTGCCDERLVMAA